MVARVVMVVDMQNGVFDTPRINREAVCERINQLIAAADRTLFIQHSEAPMTEGSASFSLLAELHQPANALYVTKYACDAFWHTGLDALLRQEGITEFVVCGCATDYCVDTTIKNGISHGFTITVAEDAHTTADRPAAPAQVLINHHNDVWRNFPMPGHPLQVRPVHEILADWRQG